jgi:hypothetical protein
MDVRLEVIMLAYIFIAFALLLRFVQAFDGSIGWGFSPIAAALVFFGSRQPRRQMWIPLTAAIATDVALNVFRYGFATNLEFLVIWAWYAGAMFAGSLIGRRPRFLHAAAAVVGSSVSFFILSNAATWAVYDFYPKTFAGLMASYVAAIPFYRPQGDLMYAALFFSIPVLMESLRRH